MKKIFLGFLLGLIVVFPFSNIYAARPTGIDVLYGHDHSVSQPIAAHAPVEPAAILTTAMAHQNPCLRLSSQQVAIPNRGVPEFTNPVDLGKNRIPLLRQRGCPRRRQRDALVPQSDGAHAIPVHRQAGYPEPPFLQEFTRF